MTNPNTLNTVSIHPSNLQNWLPQVAQIACEAGDIIMQIYAQHQCNEDCIDLESKSDGTPVTKADKAADVYISEALKALTPEIPLVTEESIDLVDFETRKNWTTYWLVDPLDGTKEFIECTGEFSVNIALIHENRPVLGVVYGPVMDALYMAYTTGGAWKVNLCEMANHADFDWLNWKVQIQSQKITTQKVIRTRPDNLHRPLDFDHDHETIRVAISRRHGKAATEFMQRIAPVKEVKMGSALKACLVAEGKADIYPRFGPTSLWDTAASQCLVEEAGGAYKNSQGLPLTYVQTESLLNPCFIVVGDASFAWPQFETY